MPLRYSINQRKRLITIRGEYAEPRDWIDLLERLLGDPRRHAGFAVLRDLRDAGHPPDSATVVRIMEAVRRFWPRLQPSRAAILTGVVIDPAALAAHALADADGLPVCAFASQDEAVDWLAEGVRQWMRHADVPQRASDSRLAGSRIQYAID